MITVILSIMFRILNIKHPYLIFHIINMGKMN